MNINSLAVIGNVDVEKVVSNANPPCIKCNSYEILEIEAKCADGCGLKYGLFEYVGYVPNSLNIGGGDCISMRLCMNCGMVQDKFPLNRTMLTRLAFGKFKSVDSDDEDELSFSNESLENSDEDESIEDI